MMSNIVTSSYPYFQYLRSVNDALTGIRDICFYPGMLFGSLEKWWPDTGMRPTNHEGIDICYYTDGNGKKQQLAPQTKIPVMAGGRVFSLCPDFLGHTVYLDHEISGSCRLLSVYAHILPDSHIHPGRRLEKAEVIGMIADTAGRKNRMAAHLHLSILTIPYEITATMLNWQFICNSSQINLIDPMTMIECDMVKIYQKNKAKEEELAKL